MIVWYFDEKEEKKLIDEIGCAELFKGKRIYFARQNKIECFLISRELEDALKLLKTNPYTLGLFLGEINKEFRPSLQLLHESAKCKEAIELLGKDEKEFTYGSDLKNKYSVFGTFIVRNKTGILGLAEFEEYKVRNIIDIGLYLRHERKSYK